MYLPSNSTILLFKTTFIVITNPADILTISGSCSIFEFALFFGQSIGMKFHKTLDT